MKVPKVRLARNIEVSRLGCGLIRIGREWGINRPGESAVYSAKEAWEFLEGAIKLGINFFDTAPAYGESERIFGEFVTAHRSLIEQAGVIVATKCGEHAPGQRDYSAPALERSIENSLRLFGGHINLLQLHSANPNVLADKAALKVMEKFKERGDIDHLGATIAWPPQVAEQAIKTRIFSTLQLPYSLLWNDMKDVIEIAHKEGLGVITNQPLARGALSQKWELSNHETRSKVNKLMEDREIEPNDLTTEAWKFIQKPVTISVILTGTRNLQHLRENLAYLDKE
ncbi:MAG: aldo/keto reductase [bacterium]